jgi:hypothetical protein
MKEEKTTTVVATKEKLSPETQAIWDVLRVQPTEFYGLQNITLEDIVAPLNLDQKKLFLQLRASAALVSLEESMNKLVVRSLTGGVVPRFVLEGPIKGMAVVSNNPEL